MADLNKVMIIGNLGKDPEFRDFSNGGRVCNFSVATTRKWKDKNTGEKKEKTEWHNIAITDKGLVTIAERFLQKGTRVYLEGQLQTRKWQDQSGADRYTTEIILPPFHGQLSIEARGKGWGDDGDNGSDGSHYDGRPGGGDPGADPDDEIPF